MARKLSLNQDQVSVLETMIILSSSTGLFSMTDLWSGWEMSKATFYRYHSPVYRDASREYSKRQYLSYRKSLTQSVCYRCQEELTEHARCLDCEILLHGGSLFGDTLDGKICVGCEDSKTRKSFRDYNELINA